jgi:hypothetical protein
VLAWWLEQTSNVLFGDADEDREHEPRREVNDPSARHGGGYGR